MTWRATVLTIFPEMLPGPLAHSLAGKALQAGIWRLETVDIRDFARDKHRSVDDAPFGGGPGMVMRPDVLDAAIAGAGGTGPLLLLSPRGRPLDQEARAGVCRRPRGDAGLRALRGRRRARHRGARDRGDQPRRFRAVGRRAGGDRADRRLRAAAARGCRTRRDIGGRELCRGSARISALYAAAGLAGAGGAGGAGVRQSRADPRSGGGRRRSG